jgi:hypothetical protein
VWPQSVHRGVVHPHEHVHLARQPHHRGLVDPPARAGARVADVRRCAEPARGCAGHSRARHEGVLGGGVDGGVGELCGRVCFRVRVGIGLHGRLRLVFFFILFQVLPFDVAVIVGGDADVRRRTVELHEKLEAQREGARR